MNGETELEQLKRFNNEKASALDKAHKKIKELEEENRLLKNIINTHNRPTGRRGEDIMREVMSRRQP